MHLSASHWDRAPSGSFRTDAAAERGQALQRIGLVLPAGFESSSFTPLAVFESANTALGEQRYDLTVLAEGTGRVPGSFGMEVVAQPFDDLDFDTILVGGASIIVGGSAEMLGYLRRAKASARRIASTGLGTFFLGEAGLLDGLRVTTHWAFIDDLRRRCPFATVVSDRIFLQDGSIWTSAGMSSGADLALALIEKDCGREVARLTARQLVMGELRAGAQSQHSVCLDLDARSDRVAMALTHARQNLRKRLSVDELADAAHLSPRQLTRIFSAETGCSPARAVERLRIEAAQLLIRQGRLPIDTIANETGFGDRERMRRAFHRAFAHSPRKHRLADDVHVSI